MIQNLTPRWMQPLKMVILCIAAFVQICFFDHIAAKVFAPEMDEELLIVVCELVRG